MKVIFFFLKQSDLYLLQNKCDVFFLNYTQGDSLAANWNQLYCGFGYHPVKRCTSGSIMALQWCHTLNVDCSHFKLKTLNIAENYSIWKWNNWYQKRWLIHLWRTCPWSVNASFDLNKAYYPSYLKLKCLTWCLCSGGCDAHRFPSSLLIHNIACYHSRVQEVKFKWGQVRIRLHRGWARY